MLTIKETFSSFSVDDIVKAEKFYAETLGLSAKIEKGMGLSIDLPGNGSAFIYPKDNHAPATFTVLNFKVENIDEAVEELANKGVHFERYEGLNQDEKGVARGRAAGMGPDIIWFKDPAGNILSVVQ